MKTTPPQVNDHTTASYVFAYHELWDSDEEVESSEFSDDSPVEVAIENNAANRSHAKTRRRQGGQA